MSKIKELIRSLPEDQAKRILELAFFLAIDASNYGGKFTDRDQLVAAGEMGNGVPPRTVVVDRIAIHQIREELIKAGVNWKVLQRKYGEATFRKKVWVSVSAGNMMYPRETRFQKNDSQYVRSEEWLWEQDLEDVSMGKARNRKRSRP